MRIDFGWSLDGAAWADGTGAAGAARLGPRGLTQLLQNRLGLTRPAVAPAVRVAQYLRLLEEHLAEVPDAWPARSFAVDPWSTAAQLLRWRDEALATGWRSTGGHLPERLEIVRDLERRAVSGGAGALAPSAADDLREILDLLEGEAAGWPLGIAEITCAEEREALPGMWPQVLTLLERGGVRVTHASADGDGAPELTMVEALDEWTAADVAARFLAASPADGLTVLAAADTDVLDRALHRRGLPALGVVGASRDRAHHQVLGLFLDVATAPVDVHQLAALLDLRVLPGADGEAEPVGLVPALARRELLGALSAEPGVGGPTWQRALARIQESGHERALEVARVIDRLVGDPLPADDLRPGALVSRLDDLAARLRAVARGEGDLLASLTQVQVAQEVLGMLDPGVPLGRRTLQQIIDSCGGSGPSPRAVREVSPWQVTTSPAQVRSNGGTVLWWGPSADDAPRPQRWDPAETAALEAGGGRVPSPTALAALEVDAALRGLRRAGEVIAVLPGRRLEKTPGPSGLLAHLGEGTRVRPEALVDGGTWSLAGRSLPVTIPAEEPERPAPPLEHRIAPVPHLLPQRLSYTQIASLLACPHHWALEYALGVRPAEVAALPTGARMIGTLVHAVVETLVTERHDPELGGMPLVAPSAEEIRQVVDRLVPQLASELDLPGRAAARADVADRAVRALEALFRGVAGAGLRITGTEVGFELPLTLELAGGSRTISFRGSRDLDAVAADGRRTVLDLKWSRSRTRYGDLFDTSEAIQLASYAWTLAEEHPGEPTADVGYFLLRSGEFVSADPALDPHRREPMDVQNAWSRMIQGVTTVLDEVAEGRIRCGCLETQQRAGLDGSEGWQKRSTSLAKARAAVREAGGLLVEDHCATSDHAHLCGTTGALR
ncbi:PD-(D/E)XK nuclease family protein [Brachybacterium aquaticum]|uniref:RecB family exonuclease n=1 Tax=Brachybacterium aquaticum TaxID=1432564 RepID=A0A841AEQ5_9MICO|nr:PD-(D/E)XK nuclease family protein [Brachybacterium aquaticum]MBB5832453.1 RecB family exonuclease [Brachybacterium aquaticum]